MTYVVKTDSFLKGLDNGKIDTVSLKALIEKDANDTKLKKIMNAEKSYKAFIVSGKKMKEMLRSKVGVNAHAIFEGIKIRVNGEAEMQEFTFSRICAALMVMYYELKVKGNKDMVNTMIIPSLGICLPKMDDDEEFNSMLCMAGPGAHFLPSYFFAKVDGEDDMRAVKMVAICMMLDWAAYYRSHPETEVKLLDFLEDEKFDDMKSTFNNMLRNCGDKLDGLNDKQKIVLQNLLSIKNKISLKSTGSAKMQKFLKSIFQTGGQ